MPRTKASRRSAAAKKRLMDRRRATAGDVVAETVDGVTSIPQPKKELTVTNLTSHNQQPDPAAAALHVVAMTDDGVMSFPPYRNSKKIPTVTFPTSHDQQPDQASQPRPVSVMAATDDGVTSFPPYWNTKKILTVTLPISHDHRVPTLGAICRTDDELFMPSLYEEKALTDDEVLQPPQKRRAAALRPSIRPSILASRMPHLPHFIMPSNPTQSIMPSNPTQSIMPSNPTQSIMPSNLTQSIKPCKMVSILPPDPPDQQQHVNPVTVPVSPHFPQASTVRGSFHQADRRFGINGNKQCVANSLMAILMCKIKNVLSWLVTDLDQVLLNGDNLYTTIRDTGRIRDASGYLFVRDLPTEYTLNGVTFAIKYHDDMFVGLFGVSEYGDMCDVLMSADAAFEITAVSVTSRSILHQHPDGNSPVTSVNQLTSMSDRLDGKSSVTSVNQRTNISDHPDDNSSVTRVQQFARMSDSQYGVVRPNVTHDAEPEVDVRVNNEGDVVFISELRSEQFLFSPLTIQQQRRLSCKLGVVYIDHGHVNMDAEFPMGDPCRTVPITGDVKKRNVEKRTKQKDKRTDITYVIEQFGEKINTGPVYICSVCHRMLFKHQVVICRKDKYLKKSQGVALLAMQCITDTYLHKCIDTCSDDCSSLLGPTGSLWICHTCHRKILDGKMPAESVGNCLALDPVPPELHCLNTLEQHLIGIHIPFMRIVSLPKGGQNGVHGPVTCVPSSIPNVAEALPRVNNDDLMIRVKLKRKLTYKGHYKYEFVHPEKIKKALVYLTENNKFYSNVQFNDDWINPLQKTEVPGDVSDIHADEERNENNMEDEEMDETLHDRQQHGMYMDTCLQPVDIAQEVLDQHFDGIMSMAPAEGNNPVRLLTDESNEAKCFPVLFPKGTGTFHDRRKEKLTLCRYLNTRILNADGRFGKNLDYIFYGQYLSELQQVVSNVSIAVRKGYDARDKCPVTSETLTNKESLQKMFNFDEGYKFLRPIRGTPVFWQSVQKDLFAMVRQLGIPTWFCSFSSADLRWRELMTAIFKQDGIDASSAELDWSERCALLKNNPVTAARMFDYRFHCFLKDVIMSEAQPIGKIVDYFYRVEFQQRGSPHTHCLFWVEDAPKVGKDDEDEVSAFIDQYVTCEMPEGDDEMHEIVCSVQQHSKRHSKTCKKKGKTCRFNFPRPPSNRTFVSSCKVGDGETDGQPLKKEVADAIMKKVKDAVLNPEANYDSVDSLFSTIGISQDIFEAAYSRITKKTTIVLKRRPCEVWVNQYNRDLLHCWNANMDIQFVVDAYSCIVYIISYISKAEREMGLLLANAQKEASQQGNLDAKEALRQLGSVFLHNREVSAQESVYRLTNMRLKEGSRKVQFIPTGENVVKMSLPLNVIRKKAECENEDEQGIWMNSITDRYKARPETKEFAGMCLARFASEYRILCKSQSSCPGSVQLDRKLGFVKKRTRTEAAVVRYARFSPTKDPEKYYHSILQLFLPHYFDAQLKPSTFGSYQEFYETGCVKFFDDELHSVKLVVQSNMSSFEKESHAIDKAEEDIQQHGVMEDAWAEICPETERERLECLASKSNTTPEMREQRDEIPDLLPRPRRYMLHDNPCAMSRQEALALLRSLNNKQSETFYKIRNWCLQKARGENPKPFHVFISGPGGVGKSVLIKAIHYEAARILCQLSQNPDETHVLLTAPTGVSAYNIKAATIHACFHIATEAKLPYEPLADEKINSLRAELGNLQILIIDEISMVDHKLLAYVHGRLRQIKQIGDYSAFGNVSIIAVGDFYQLCPVKGKALYTEGKGVDLWQNHFAMVELTEIMRQKDMQFAQLLNRLRKRKRGDAMLEEDIAMLKLRVTGEGQDSTGLHIYATNDEVDQHNYHMLRKICSDHVIIHAQDFQRVAATGRLEKKHGHHANVQKTCLPESLHVGVNARVILLKNIDVSDGLVNGAFGTVSDICFDTDEDFPSEIYITFDNEAAGKSLRGKKPCLKAGLDKATRIKAEEERVTNSGGTRRQFPLKLAWACTVHKVQGLTVDKAVVSLKKIFAAGQAYVALSRVTSLEGLIIEDFKETAIYAKQDIETAMQSMPAFIEPVMEVPSSCKILLHNVEGLTCHLDDLKQDRRPPLYNLAIFQKNLMQLITRLDSVEGGKIIMGDFNENLLQPREAGTATGAMAVLGGIGREAWPGAKLWGLGLGLAVSGYHWGCR
ncbi:uncharacterized protein [Paramormyrops kingsleyae]|uniref:uncharacterized protein n=1 Tax=Paramormyrops kingsleyae TaxID=1676925 RepID=UPI003B96F3D0